MSAQPRALPVRINQPVHCSSPVPITTSGNTPWKPSSGSCSSPSPVELFARLSIPSSPSCSPASTKPAEVRTAACATRLGVSVAFLNQLYKLQQDDRQHKASKDVEKEDAKLSEQIVNQLPRTLPELMSIALQLYSSTKSTVLANYIIETGPLALHQELQWYHPPENLKTLEMYIELIIEYAEEHCPDEDTCNDWRMLLTATRKQYALMLAAGIATEE